MGKRLPMNQAKEILRLVWTTTTSVRAIARALGISVGVVSKMRSRAEHQNLSWEQVEVMSEDELKARLYGRGKKPGKERPEPDLVELHKQMMRPGVTMELLHQEYLTEHPHGYKYTAFCNRYRAWKKKQKVSMRQPHKAGEKLFIDYSGKKPHYVDQATGDKVPVELFVATFGASNYTFAMATATQQIPDFLRANTLALEYFGGAPKAIIPDRLKSAVTGGDPYEPTIQRSFLEFSRHYGTSIVPARSYRPKDKAKVEGAVLIAQRRIMARMREETFFSLTELNERIGELLEELNDRGMKTYGGASRRELFEQLDRPALRSLPSRRFEPQVWKRVRVNKDYHVAIQDHYYSVPYHLVSEVLEACITARTVEFYLRGQRVASHAFSQERYSHTTDVKHMPKNHREYAEGGTSLLEWSNGVGPHTNTLMRRIFDRSPIKIQGWRSGRGLRRMAEKFGDKRTEEACRRALLHGATSYKPVARMLKNNLDLRPLPDSPEAPEGADEPQPIEHDQVRGPDHFFNTNERDSC